MKKMYLALPLLALAVVPLLTGCAERTVYVQSPPPPAPAEPVVVSPGPAYVWVPGYWGWDGARYVWVGGHWAYPPHPRAVWVGPHWGYRSGVRVWIGGYWH